MEVDGLRRTACYEKLLCPRDLFGRAVSYEEVLVRLQRGFVLEDAVLGDADAVQPSPQGTQASQRTTQARSPQGDRARRARSAPSLRRPIGLAERQGWGAGATGATSGPQSPYVPLLCTGRVGTSQCARLHLQGPFLPPLRPPTPLPGAWPLPWPLPRPSRGPFAPVEGPVPSRLGI